MVRGSGQGDWPQGPAAQAELWSWWTTGVAEAAGIESEAYEAWTRLGNATNSYNCGGHIFASSGLWISDVHNYIGTTSGCWEKNVSGTIRIEFFDNNAYHACTASYVGKAGRMFLQDHNDDLYGVMDLYRQVP